MGMPFSGPPFFCSLAFPGLRECLFLYLSVPNTVAKSFPGRKDSLFHGKATSESEFGQDNGLTRSTGDPLQN